MTRDSGERGTGFQPVFEFAVHGLEARATRSAITSALLALLLNGCIMGKQHPAATQPATAADPKSIQNSYWMDKPATMQLTGNDFDRLWLACQSAIQDHSFTIDRSDYREGILSSLPLDSKQAYEVWRSDVVDLHGLVQSSLATVRRTVRFDIRHLPDGSYEARPKVLVERLSTLNKRITSVTQYREAFSLTLQDLRLSAEEEGSDIPPQYWYPIGRDDAMERQLVDSVRRRLR
jgi:hypothetical protein